MLIRLTNTIFKERKVEIGLLKNNMEKPNIKEQKLKKKEPKVFIVNKNKIFLRVILFIVAIAAAIYFLGTALIELLNPTPVPIEAWYTISAKAIDGSVEKPFEDQIGLDYFFDEKNQDDAKAKYDLLYTLFNNRILALYKNFSNDFKSSGIGYINDHKGQKIVLDAYLYACLKDAYNKTLSSNGIYNIFAGEIYEFWKDISNDNYSIYRKDPIFNMESKLFIDEAVACLSDNTKYSLSFDDLDKSVVYTVNESCTGKISLNFQNLTYAYVIEDLAKLFIDSSYSDGWFYSVNGYQLFMNKNPEDYEGRWRITTYMPNSNILYKSENVASVYEHVGKVSVVTFGDYGYENFNNGRYDFETGEADNIQYYRRHLFFNSLTGYSTNILRGVQNISTEKKLTDMALDNIIMMNCANINESASYVKNHASVNNHFLILSTDNYKKDVITTLMYDEFIVDSKIDFTDLIKDENIIKII